jgi:L-threonylcarbamoyladenylate synthase
MRIATNTNYFTKRAALKALRSGEVIVYPTDTIYGLGADATNTEAVARVQHIKQRDANKPILAMVADRAMLQNYAVMTPLAERLADRFLPGPLTLVLAARDERLSALTAPDGSVGFRMPDTAFCLRMAHALGRPITSTSVNNTGEEPAQEVQRAVASLGDRSEHLSLVIDVGPVETVVPSTIVDARGERAVLLREGAIAREVLLPFL